MRLVRDLRLEIVTIPLLKMEEKTAKVLELMKNHVQKAIVQEMAIGALGPHGHHVMRHARDLRLEIATIPLIRMEEKIAKV